MFTQSWAWSQRSPSWICKTLQPRVRHSAARLGEESETATLSMSKATEGDFASRPSRSSDRSRTVSSSVSVGGRSRSDGGPMPSGNNGSESHRSRSGEWSRRDRGHGSERSHKSSRFHHSTRHRESGERARPKSSSEGSSSRSKQADVMDVRPSTSTHHQHHHNPRPLHLGYGLVLPRLKLRRQRLLAGLPDPVTRRRPFHRASLWWEDPGRTAAQCLPGPTDLNAIDYAVVFGADEVHGSERLQNTPRSGHSPRHRRSGEQTRPMSSGGFSSRARHADPTSSLEVIGGSWVRSGSQLHDRCESVDSVMSGLSYVSRREVQLSPVAPQQTEKRTITVIPLPPRPADDGPASDGLAGDDLASDSPADDGPAYDGSAGDGSSRLVSFGWPSSCDRTDGLCTTQQLLLTQHSIRRFRLSTPIASSLQLLCPDALLKNFGFQPQVLSTVRTAPFESSRVLGPEPKVLQNTLRTIRQVDWMAGSSFTFAQRHRDSKSSRKAMSSKKTTSRTSVADHDFDDSNTIVVLSCAWQEFFLAKSRIAPRTSRTCRCSVPVKPDFWTFDNPTSCLNTCLCLHLPSLLSRPFRPLHPWWLLLRLCRPWCKTGKTPSSSPWRPNGRRWWVMLHPSRLRVPLFCAIWTPAGCGSWVPLMTKRHHGLRFSLVQRERTVALGSGAPLVMGLRPAEMDGSIYVSFETPVPLCLPPTDHHRHPNGWELTVAVPHTALALRTTAGEALVPVAIVLLLLTPVVTAVLRPHTPNVVVPEIIPLSPVILHRPAWLGDLPGTYPCHPGAVLPRRCSDHPETIVCPLAPGGCPLIAAAATLHLGHLHLDLVGDNVPILAVRAPGLLTGILKDVNTRRNNSSQASWRFPCSSTGWWPRRRTDFVSWRFPLVRGGSQETLWWPTLPFGLVSLCWSLPSYRPDKQSVGTLC